jgi:predicted metal-dependent phosphoesterase TrpH
MDRRLRVARAIAWGLVIGSIALGGTSSPPERPSIRSGRHMVLAGDFHVHSFPGDGGLLPWDIADEARRRRLDVIALTNHNSLWSWRLAERLARRRDDVIVLPGIELTSAGYHMTSIGVRKPVPWRQPPVDAIAAVHAQGGVAIAAHPLSPRPSKWDDAAIDALDGFEAASSNDTLSEISPFTMRATARHPGAAAIGASDFHYFAPLGVSRTFLFVTERSAAAVLEAIRSGRTVACDGRGETYGPSELVPAVEEECRRAAMSGPSGWRWIDGVSTCAAWIGLAALVALGWRR